MQDVPGARFDLRVFSEDDARNTVFVEWLYLVMTVAVHLGGLYNVVYICIYIYTHILQFHTLPSTMISSTHL